MVDPREQAGPADRDPAERLFAARGDPGTPPADRSQARAGEDLRFARILGSLGAAILFAAAVLLVLPLWLSANPLVYLIAWGACSLFGPVGFSLLGASRRLRLRTLYGEQALAAHRGRLALLGGAIVLVGFFVAFGGLGVSGPISRGLNLVWGLSLVLYGVRFLFRALLAEAP